MDWIKKWKDETKKEFEKIYKKYITTTNYEETLEELNQIIFKIVLLHDKKLTVKYFYMKSYCLYMMKKYRRALWNINKVLFLKKSLRAINLKILILTDFGKEKKAINYFNKCKAKYDVLKNISCLNDIANAYYMIKDYDKAIAYYDKAIKLQQNDKEVLVSLGNIWGDLGKKAKAIELYDRAIKLDNTFIDAYYNKAITLKLAGDYDESLKLFETIVEKMEIDNCDIEFIAELNVNISYIKYVLHTRRYANQKEINSKYHSFVTEIYIIIGNLEQQYNLVEKLSKSYIRNYILYFLSFLYYKVGNYEMAVERLIKMNSTRRSVKKIERERLLKECANKLDYGIFNWWCNGVLNNRYDAWLKRIVLAILINIIIFSLYLISFKRNAYFIDLVLMAILVIVFPIIKSFTFKGLEVKLNSPFIEKREKCIPADKEDR